MKWPLGFRTGSSAKLDLHAQEACRAVHTVARKSEAIIIIKKYENCEKHVGFQDMGKGNWYIFKA